MGSRRTYLRLVILSMFVVALSGLSFAQGWQIVSADYGAGDHRIDVTGRVIHLMHDTGSFPINNETMGGDPAPGEVKSLHIRASRPDGRVQDFNYRERESLDAGMFAGGPGGRDDRGPGEGYHEGDRDRDRDRGPGPIWGRGPKPRRGACFFRDADFSGDYFCMEAGQSYGYLPPGFNDRISSIRTFHAGVVFYNDHDFTGVRAETRRSLSNLKAWRLPTDPSRTWNDRISSIQVQ